MDPMMGAPPGGAQYGAPPGGNQYGAPPQPDGGFGAQPGFGAGPGPGMGGPMQPYGGMGGPMSMPGAGGPQKSWLTTLLLAFFAGYLGVHRFYTGHTLLGVLQLLTCGGLGIWTWVDIIFILMGKYTDAQGRPLQKS
jgi:hypothetical protein